MAAPNDAQVFESNRKPARDTLTITVARPSWTSGGGRLYDPSGDRKYLNREERDRFLAAAETAEPKRCLFALLMVWSGARISEILALTPSSFQLDTGVVTIVTLKRRKFAVRDVPLPPKLMARLGYDRFGAAGLPIGLQIVGPNRGEVACLQLARAYEAATGWTEKRPPAIKA